MARGPRPAYPTVARGPRPAYRSWERTINPLGRELPPERPTLVWFQEYHLDARWVSFLTVSDTITIRTAQKVMETYTHS